MKVSYCIYILLLICLTGIISCHEDFENPDEKELQEKNKKVAHLYQPYVLHEIYKDIWKDTQRVN